MFLFVSEITLKPFFIVTNERAGSIEVLKRKIKELSKDFLDRRANTRKHMKQNVINN
jgi:hypothetical protein